METPQNHQPTPITRIEILSTSETLVDSKCEMPTQTRWQIVLFAAIAIALASGFLYGIAYLAEFLL